MKIFIVAIFIIAAASMAKSDVQIMKAETTVKECADQIKVAPEIVAKIRAGDWSEHNTEAKELSKCFFNKSGFIDPDGNLNEAILIERLSATFGDKQKAEQLVKDCNSKENIPKDELPLNFYKCFLEAKTA